MGFSVFGREYINSHIDLFKWVKKDYQCLFTMEAYMSSIGSKLQMLYTSDHASVVSMNLFVALLCACIVIGHLLEETRWMNESITALTIVSLFLLNL